jgi:hypothetical protein
MEVAAWTDEATTPTLATEACVGVREGCQRSG